VRESRIHEDGKVANGSSSSKRLAAKSTLVDNMDVDSQGVDGETEDFDELIGKTMGFSSFRSTQNTKVPGNNIYGVRKEKKTVYRQYMNRKGGFNRPLSPSR
jgi:U4/U6.U5 tri-snRNP-associated protein 3